MILFEEARPIALGRSALSGDNLHTLHQACQMVEALPGAVAEVGVYKGGSAKFMMKCLPGKTFWLFDTFAGIPVANEGGHPVGDFASDLDEVVAFLSRDGFDNHIIVPGVFPESAEDYLGGEYILNEEKFCLVHLDTDTYEATKAGLEFFWPLMVQGGKFYIHDYDWHACPGVKPAVEEFLATLPEGAVTNTVIDVMGSIKYLCIVKLVNETTIDAGCVLVSEQFCTGCGDCDDEPITDCGKLEAIEPVDTTPLEEGPTPEGMTAEPVKTEDLKPTSVAEIASPLDQIASGEVNLKLKDRTLKKKDQ